MILSLSRFGQFHENPAVISWWQARAGRVLAWLTPMRRRTLLALLAVWVGIKKPWEKVMEPNALLHLPLESTDYVLVAAALFFLLWLCYRAACHFAALPAIVRRHPVLGLHLLYWAVILLLLNTTPEVGHWRAIVLGIALVFSFLIWRLSYLLQSGQYGRVAGTRFRDHLFYLYPAFGGGNTPYGKGLDYLSRHEAGTPQELARSQLAGVRLLYLALLCSVIKFFMDGLVYGPGNELTAALEMEAPPIPYLDDMVAGKPGSTPLWQSWLGIYCELIRQVLRHAIKGHIIIATLRLFGFNVFRNTYKPLLAESVVAFWGRYYYYFKELLVTFFFLPTYARLGAILREWPNLRLFAAVLAAAFFGNTYYHLLKTGSILAIGGISLPWSRVFYCLLLAIGVFVSMWREKRRAGEVPGRARRVLRIAGVWTFFAIIYIWNTSSADDFFIRSRFFLGLFGLA